MNNTECMKSVRDYCSASKMVHNDVEDACINVVKVPKAPTCPFKYFDLIDATNPCDITSCNINSAGEICKNAVVVYCTRSKEEKGDVEVGCLTVGKTPIMVTTTAAPITSTTPVPSYCPYKYTNLDAKSPCLVNACQNSTENVECMDAIKIYCLESKHVNNGIVELGCVSIIETPLTSTTTTSPGTSIPFSTTTRIPFSTTTQITVPETTTKAAAKANARAL